MKVNTFELSSRYYDFALNNPSKAKPIHAALYHYCIHLNNKLQWAPEFGLPTQFTMSACGVKNYRTYKNALIDLVEWNFLKLVELSKNQHTATIISICFGKKVQSTAIGIAQSTGRSTAIGTAQSTVDIIKPKTINIKQETKKEEGPLPEFKISAEAELAAWLSTTHNMAIRPNERSAISGIIGYLKTVHQNPVGEFKRMFDSLDQDPWWGGQNKKRFDLAYVNDKINQFVAAANAGKKHYTGGTQKSKYAS